MSELRFEERPFRAAELCEESCVPDLLGEHILQNSLEFRLDEYEEIFEGYGRRRNAYPYRQLNSYTRELKERNIITAVLENEHIRAVFLPEYGGRLWELWDKKKNRNLLYTNDVIRFSNLAIRNAWFSGGVEWNIGVIGHNPYTASPLYTATLKTDNGTPVLRFYEYERIRRLPYQIDFWLEDEDRALNCRIRVMNESAEVVPMYWWSNIAVREHEGGHITVPADSAFTFADGCVSKVDIPYVNGIDITEYQNIPKSVDYFFDIRDGEIRYIANHDKDGYGLLHVSTSRLRSRKLFSWGHGQASDHWQEFLTENAGPYVEIQAGLGKTQYGCIPMPPHSAWEWMEQYGPVEVPASLETDEERRAYITGCIKNDHRAEELESLLVRTRPLAKKKAERIILEGSGYGAFEKNRKYSSYLEYTSSSESLARWKSFFETGVLQNPPADCAPDEFLIDSSNLDFLISTLDKENKDNWYAYYHAGIGCYIAEDFRMASEFLERSYVLKPNPWACHAIACIYLVRNRMNWAGIWITKGLELEKRRISYLKEAFRILTLSEGYEALITCYEKLDVNIKNIGKLKFYYINALHKLGCNEKAYSLLMENGGLVIDDIREGEDSVAQLWADISKAIGKDNKEIPYIFDFRAF